MPFYQFIIFLISKILCDINIHIIPHTHLDPIWVKTQEENTIINIFDVILEELLNTTNSQKTFVINEIFYFIKWYENLSVNKKNKFKDLLEEKRIEFVSGEYAINDEDTEDTPIFYEVIAQLRFGHQYFFEKFGIIPKTGWFIDSINFDGDS